MVGININCKNYYYIKDILNGLKKEETRDQIKGKRIGPLHCYLGQRVGLIETGKGKAVLRGYATITAIYGYDTKEEFDSRTWFHRVYDDEFGWHGVKKYGYVLEDVEECDRKIITSKGNVARKI